MQQRPCQLHAPHGIENGILYLRGSSPKSEEDPRQEELRVDIGSLDKQKQGQANDGISNHGNEANTQTVRYQAPEGACDQGYDLIDKAQSTNDITDAIFDMKQVGDDKGNAAVKEDEERDREERDSEQVADSLKGCGRLRDWQMPDQDVSRHDWLRRICEMCSRLWALYCKQLLLKLCCGGVRQGESS